VPCPVVDHRDDDDDGRARSLKKITSSLDARPAHPDHRIPCTPIPPHVVGQSRPTLHHASPSHPTPAQLTFSQAHSPTILAALHRPLHVTRYIFPPSSSGRQRVQEQKQPHPSRASISTTSKFQACTTDASASPQASPTKLVRSSADAHALTHVPRSHTHST